MSETSFSQETSVRDGFGGLTVKEVAFILNVSPQSVYAWCRDGKLKHFRVMGTIRIREEALAYVKTT